MNAILTSDLDLVVLSVHWARRHTGNTYAVLEIRDNARAIVALPDTCP